MIYIYEKQINVRECNLLSAEYSVSKITITCCCVVFSEVFLVVHVFIFCSTKAGLIQTANDTCCMFNVSVHLGNSNCSGSRG